MYIDTAQAVNCCATGRKQSSRKNKQTAVTLWHATILKINASGKIAAVSVTQRLQGDHY